MNDRKTIAISALGAVAAVAAVCLFFQNRALKQEMAAMMAEREAAIRRPKMRIPPRPPARPRSLRAEQVSPSPAAHAGNPAGEGAITEERLDQAVNARIAALRQKAEDARARRREAIAALTPEQKEVQREAFIGKMRERAQQRLKAFVSKTGLNESQTAAFESTVSALDATLRETADAWAEQIRKSGTFTRDAQRKFVSDVSTVIRAGYGEMDATLPESWRTADGNVNLMEIVGPEAFATVVDALTESGLEDGLQTIGQIMGGPNGERPDGGPGLEGIESPGVGDGPGGMNGPGGMGGPGSGIAPPAGR